MMPAMPQQWKGPSIRSMEIPGTRLSKSSVGLADLLFPQVTWGIVCHPCRDRTQIVIEFPCVKEGSEVFSQIEVCGWRP